ncbi:cytochrome P450 [Actinomadura sp. NEAU-AAG7]|uniref:cytochrome P450 n=1 Tax=Actinomadura sp. NEAU-AAG7 TaxID=2839640 RepID=UPI001BE3FFEA|nr:cytochrome P450 [Actinomadura sp. NEAU-AAG7]MBT2211260.1 cytochrome P450 [Actinomadura sp. NEAU-AAG7]
MPTDHIIDYPSSADHAGELPPEFDAARGPGPLPRVRLPDGRTAWLVTRHEDVRTVLAGGSFTRDLSEPRDGGSGGASPVRTVNMDGRPHLELRGLVSRAFTVRRVEAMRPRVQEVTDRLLDAMEEQGPPADLVRHLAAPLPSIVICELLGFPHADHAMLGDWCDRITAVGGEGLDQSAGRELGAYIDRAVRARRAGADSGTDLLSTLVQAHDEEERLGHEELISLAIVLLAGGLETTQTAISAGLVRLLRNPEQLGRLRADPGLLGSTIEELLRFQPVIDLNRVQKATEDVRLGGRLVRAGDLVQISINAANRDEDAFSCAARFEIAREPNPHLAFGHGAHHCLGAALARAELRAAFATLLRRFPRLDLAVPPESLRWRGGHVTLRLEELPVTW